jgi:polysaccharide export outer membrane protein
VKWYWLASFTVAVGLVVAPACSPLPKEILDEANRPAKEFLIGPEDVLDITVWRNADLSKQVTVRPDGMITMPLIGDVRASGRTAEELAEEITKRLKEFKESPSVAVSVKEVNSYYVYVLGEVSKPGKMQLKSHTTVLQAIAQAGGFTQFASRNSMQVLRMVQNGSGELKQIRIPLSYSDLVAGKGEVGNFIMRTGDTLVVP